jgi:hypothetical protein
LVYGGGDFALSWNCYRPSQIFAEFARTYCPLLQISWCDCADIYDGPVAGKAQRRGAVGQRAANYEVVVAMNQDSYHLF